MLFESPDETGTLNHLGVERGSMEEVEAEASRLEAAGMELRVEGDVVCCYARQDKHWVTGPDGQEWENYVVLADAHAELEGKTTQDLAAAGQTRRGRLLVLRRGPGGLLLVTVRAATLSRRLVAEGLGTGLLVTVVVGSGIAAGRLSPHDRDCSCSRTPPPLPWG